MSIQQTPLPTAIQSELSELLQQIREYLELEELEAPAARDLVLANHCRVTSSTSMVVFEYPSKTAAEPGLAIFTYPHAEDGPPPCIACWPRTAGQTIEWSVEEFLRYNRVD